MLTSHHLLVMVLVVQPRMLLDFASGVHWWHMVEGGGVQGFCVSTNSILSENL